YFFFSSRRRHTRFSRDWSSDVCSSDLLLPGAGAMGIVLAPSYGPPVSPTRCCGRILEGGVRERNKMVECISYTSQIPPCGQPTDRNNMNHKTPGPPQIRPAVERPSGALGERRPRAGTASPGEPRETLAPQETP